MKRQEIIRPDGVAEINNCGFSLIKPAIDLFSRHPEG